MKLHIHKQQAKEKYSFMQIIGLSSPTPCYEIYAWLEVTPEERMIIERSPDLQQSWFIEYYYRESEVSPSVRMMMQPPSPGTKGFRFVAYNSQSYFNLEKQLVEATETLKSHVDALNETGGSSVVEF
jgi:hypothetical protein